MAEPAYRALMAAYANGGDVSKAVATYDRLVQGCRKILGSSRPNKPKCCINGSKRLEAGCSERDNHPGKGTSAYSSRKVVPTFPLPKVRHSNLPRPLTSFIGREKEIKQVERLVSGARLVTITGSGGVGKTRLAIQVAVALEPHFRDGAWWVELAAISAGGAARKREPEHHPGM